MAGYLLHTDWTEKPPLGTPLRADGHSLTHGLLLAGLFNEFADKPRDAVHQTPHTPTLSTGASWGWNSRGLVLLNSAANANATLEFRTKLTSDQCLSMTEGTIFLLCANMGATSGDQGVFQAADSGGTQRRWILHTGTVADSHGIRIHCGGAYRDIATSGVPRFAPHSVAVTWRNGGENGAGYLNGLKRLEWTGGTVQTALFSTVPLHGSCNHYLLLTHGRALSAAEIAALPANPWQVAQPRQFWLGDIAAGAQTYTEALASLADTYSSVSGIATFLDAGQTIIAAGVSANGTAQMLDSILSTAQSASTLTDLAQRTDALLAVVQAADSVQAAQGMVDTLVNSAAAQIDVADSQLSAGSEALQTAVNAAATVQDIVVALERFSATVSAQASVVDEQINAAADNLLTAAQGIANVADLQLMVDNLTIIAQSTASLTEISSYLDQLASAATGAASVSDTLVSAFVGRYIFRNDCTPRRFSDQARPRHFNDRCRPRVWL